MRLADRLDSNVSEILVPLHFHLRDLDGKGLPLGLTGDVTKGGMIWHKGAEGKFLCLSLF